MRFVESSLWHLVPLLVCNPTVLARKDRRCILICAGSPRAPSFGYQLTLNMKIFISSVIGGLAQYRDAAARAARTLRHIVKRSEDFAASPDSPQRLCLAGVREADVTLLILEEAYGEPQQTSGLSATHEEYREARERGDVLVFIQEGVTREPLQDAFVREVQSWSGGQYTATFSTADELHDAVIRALHELELARRSGNVDESEVLGRAKALLIDERSASGASLCVIVAGAPRQQVLRPAELESKALIDVIMQTALFGGDQVFDRGRGSTDGIQGHHLVIQQDRAAILLTQLGDIRVVQPTQREGKRRGSYLPSLVEEDVQDTIARALRFAAWLLDHVDPNRRLGSVAPVVALVGAGYLGWLTQAERDAHPHSVSLGNVGEKSHVVALTPPVRPRPALASQAAVMAEDLTVLLKREKRR